jgi:hypothetical protein
MNTITISIIISELDIFPLISTKDIVNINEMTILLQNMGQSDVTDISINVNFEGLDRRYECSSHRDR